MQLNRLSCTTHTNRWWLVAAIAAIVIGATHSNAVAAVGDGPEPATNQQRGLNVSVVVGIPAQAGDITATAMRRIGADVFAALEPGDKITIAAARGSGRPVEILSIIRRAEDVGAAGAATVARAWREKADPLAGRSADVAAGLAELLAGRGDASIDLLVVVPAVRVGSAGASSIWASAKRARDDGAVVWLIGPPDSDLQDAAKTGVLNWTSVDAATPAACAAWVAQARRNHGGGPSVAELQGEIEKVRGELTSLRAQGEKDRAAVAGEIAARDARIKALEREAEEAIAGRRAAEAREAVALVQSKEHERSVAEARADADAGAKKIQTLTHDLELANARRVTAERALDDFKTSADAAGASFEERLRAASVEGDRLRAENFRLHDDNTRLQAALNQTRKSVSENPVPTTTPPAPNSSPDADSTSGPSSDATPAKVGTQQVTPLRPVLWVGAATVLVIVCYVTWSAIRRRSDLCRIAGTWSAPDETWRPFETTFDPAVQVVALPPGAEPHPTSIDDVADRPHLSGRGSNIEVRDPRADAEIIINGDVSPTTIARVSIGDKVAVRHPGADATTIVVRSIQRLARPRQERPASSSATAVAVGG